MSTTTLYIDGTWAAASDGGTREIRCPADGELVGRSSEATAADAARRSRRHGERSTPASGPAPPRWSAARSCSDVADRLRERKAEFARAETLDTGKRLVESEIDMDDIATASSTSASSPARTPAASSTPAARTVVSRIEYEPVGVCALIAPWNYPLLQAAWKIAPAWPRAAASSSSRAN